MRNTIEKMNVDENTIYKEVVVIGNGPSGILVSLMLSGRLPHLTSTTHPDEMLSTRLKTLPPNCCLLSQDLQFLSQGLEGRCNNPVSLLMDALLNPCADLGLDLEPLVEFRRTGKEVEHLVLGRGPPGGSWHRIDPEVLTLSLAKWMALPSVSFPTSPTNEKRALTRHVASYYEKYVRIMGLEGQFKDTVVTQVVRLNKSKRWWVKRDVVERVKEYFDPVREDSEDGFIQSALNCWLGRGVRKNRAGKKREVIRRSQQVKSDPIIIPKYERKRSISCCCCCECDPTEPHPKSPHSKSLENKPIPLFRRMSSSENLGPRWMVQATNSTGHITRYTCKYLVLACGTYDSPNRLQLPTWAPDPDWLFHDQRALEARLEEDLSRKEHPMDPVMIVGAGLSAADAIMAVRAKNIPIVHVFRGKSAEFTRQLPENMYPEYHKVRQMMIDDASTYPLYKAYPSHNVISFDAPSRTVLLATSNSTQKVRVSYAAVLIGSKPNLSFLPPDMDLGVFKGRQIDSKSNPVDVNPWTHEVVGEEGLFAVGPLAGDNFVRYLPGGAVAAVGEILRRGSDVKEEG